MNRLLIAGTNSGCGKTTVTVALLAALKARGLDISSFKCGPDYIDPMFHREIFGVDAHNLDLFFCGPEMLRRIFVSHAGGDFSIIEGVMGYYDGIGSRGEASTYQVARVTDTPVVLVIDARGMSVSSGALLEGFLHFRRDSRIRGVIFNGISQNLYPMLAEIAGNAGVTPYGFLPWRQELSIKSRYLGLVTAGEIEDIREKTSVLGTLAESYMDIEGLMALAKTAGSIQAKLIPIWQGTPLVRIAVSRDKAFCFLYRENIELLEGLGCGIIYFSPLKDIELPANIGGLYLCGGYPELYAEELSANTSMLRSIRERIKAGLPAIAECGGFMYLNEKLGEYPMTGVVPGRAFETSRLQRFGYITLTASEDNLLCKAGESIRAHEFHYWDSTDCGSGFTAEKAGKDISYPCVHTTESLYAGFPHLYFPANPAFAEAFVKAAHEAWLGGLPC
ncbi:MAG: cobyrinate a,c-diamide synthase [Clostridiaceae bacterium]|nr:cobyrinate a,c-diamide synthase [Clostridiaceae bacterium]